MLPRNPYSTGSYKYYPFINKIVYTSFGLDAPANLTKTTSFPSKTANLPPFQFIIPEMWAIMPQISATV